MWAYASDHQFVGATARTSISKSTVCIMVPRPRGSDPPGVEPEIIPPRGLATHVPKQVFRAAGQIAFLPTGRLRPVGIILCAVGGRRMRGQSGRGGLEATGQAHDTIKAALPAS